MNRISPGFYNPSRSRGALAVVSLFLLWAAFPTTQAASFDCKKASTQVEKLICADPELSSLDDKLSTAYHLVLAAISDKAMVKRHQSEWLKNRDTCPDKPCLKAHYEARLAALADPGGRARKQELVKIMKTVNFVPHSGKDDPFCQAFYRDFSTQTNIEHIHPLIAVQRYDDPALQPYQRKCPDLKMHKSMAFSHRDLEVAGEPTSESDAESRAVSITTGLKNFQFFRLDVNNQPRDGEELLLYYEGVFDQRSGTHLANRAYHEVNLSACKSDKVVYFNQGGSVQWTRNGVVRYKGKNAIYVLGSWTDKPEYWYLQLEFHSAELKRMAPSCSYRKPRQGE